MPRLAKGVIAGHCDCMYFVNTHRWDFAQVAALIAPRPLLLGNSDADDIFPVAGYRRIAEKVRKVYALYGAEEKFQLLETKGPHKDTPELRIGINKWMNRWLKDDTTTEVEDDLPPPLKPAQLKVLDEVARRAHQRDDPRTVREAGAVELPANPAVAREWWAAKKPELLAALKEKVFAGWPKNPPPLGAKVAADMTRDGVRLRAIDFVSESQVELRLFVMTSAKVEKPAEVILSVLDDAGWDRWCAGLGPDFADALQLRRAAEARRRDVRPEPRRDGVAEARVRGDRSARNRRDALGRTGQLRRRHDPPPVPAARADARRSARCGTCAARSRHSRHNRT